MSQRTYEPSPRNAAYKDKILTAPYEICIERARYVTQAFRETRGQHPSIRAARAFEKTVRNMSVSILDCEKIVGNRTSKLVGTLLSVERGDVNTVLEMELDALENRERQPYRIDPEDKRELLEDIIPYWCNRSLRARKKSLWTRNGLRINLSLTPWSIYRRRRRLDMKTLLKSVKPSKFSLAYALKGIEEITFNNPAMVMNVFDVQGHMILGHKNVLPIGFKGIEQKVRERLDRCRAEHDLDGEAFCEAALICCGAIREFAKRFADLARETALQTADAARRSELEAIAERCDRVPYHPPRDFKDALQSLWLTQVGGLVAYGQTAIFAVGRPDQYLYPYYKQDLEAGTITRGEALDLIEELLIKLSSNLLMIPTGGKNTGNELGADSQAPTVGGLGPDGEDATNELSYIFMDAVGNLRALGNTFSIRTSDKSPKQWHQKIAEVYSVTSGPAVFNDETVAKALTRCGCEPEDALDYGVIGCVEPTPDGNTFGCTSGNDISLTGALEMTLFRGRLWIMGRRVGPDTGDPRKLETFDRFMEAYKRQVSFMIDTVARGVDLKDQAYAENFHSPYVSLTLDGCIENATDMTRGGAKYNFSSISARGLGTAADSLAAIKSLVYDQGKYTMNDLLRALRNNFHDKEPMRQFLLKRAPKFGCDDDEADAIAKDVAEFFCLKVSAKKSYRGGAYRPGFFSYGMHVLEGGMLGATPNGRLAGQPVSNSFSPSNGAESGGPTAVMRSVAKIDHSLITNGCALNIKMHPSMLADEERREKFTALIQGYFATGGMEVQFNVVDNATLRDAQAHPEKYRDLVVRVSGYSAFFTDLGESIQNEIIARTEFDRH